jgi:hypothetical protein
MGIGAASVQSGVETEEISSLETKLRPCAPVDEQAARAAGSLFGAFCVCHESAGNSPGQSVERAVRPGWAASAPLFLICEKA